jgi:hypothetical protein
MRIALGCVLAVAAFSCSKPPTPMSVCQSLTNSGIAAACHEEQPKGLGARANAEAVFDLPSVPGHGGGVYSFASDEDYKATVDAFAAMATLAGAHRYGNPSRRIFVQLNESAPLDVGKKTKALVDSL